MKNLRHLMAGCGAAALPAFLVMAGTMPASAAPSCMPKIEGPIAITATSKPYVSPSNPYGGPNPPAGEKEEEFFASCTVSGGAYKTVIHVTLPTDAAKQSGIVIAEPWHGGDFWTIYDKAKHYINRAGHVSVVIVGSNHVLTDFLKKAMPERYASLHLSGPTGAGRNAGPPDTTESEVLGQVGAYIKKNGLPGIKVRKIVLGGMSGTGQVTRAYMAYEHSTPEAKSVYDGYFPEQAAGAPEELPDFDVPVVEIQGEREIVAVFERGGDHLRYRRPDGPLYRLYEVPGAPHIASRDKIEPGVPDCTEHPWTNYPTDMLFNVALDNLVQWVDKGIPTPAVPRMDTSPDGGIIHRDEFGNALGGLRSTYLDVPIATYHASWGNYVTTSTGPSDPKVAKCDQIGWTNPLPKETLKRLYPTHADYVAKVDKDAADLVSKHWLLPEDAAILHDEAVKASVP